MKIYLSRRRVRPSSVIPGKSQIEKILKNIFRSERKTIRGDLNVIFVDNSIIRKMNKTFLNENTETDVIAFPYKEKDLFGDVFISVPVARENAKRYGDSPQREVIRLIVHGVLHLLGYDDHKRADRKKMWKKQETFVEQYSPR